MGKNTVIESGGFSSRIRVDVIRTPRLTGGFLSYGFYQMMIKRINLLQIAQSVLEEEKGIFRN